MLTDVLLTANFNIGVVNGPVSITTATTNATCGNPNGTTTITSVTGGTAPYQYSLMVVRMVVIV